MSKNPTLRVVPLDLKPGEVLLAGQRFGHYEIASALGKGGMGAVYEAIDLDNGRRVALKVLTHSLDSPEARKRFLREGRLAAAINHPNSVYVFGTEEIEGTPVIAMELVAGGSLENRVREHGPLPVTVAVEAVLQIIAGLEAAHAAGILHRDVKPANCFVDTDGKVKIGDFGLSISTESHQDSRLTLAGSFMGTPAFSSPEQLRGEPLTVGSDIYAVGVTFYYLLTGKPPFQGENMVQLLATVLERPAPSPALARREIPRGLCRVILRCLEKQPADRFKNYAQLRAALMPYSLIAPTPATLGLRFLAGGIDAVLLSMALSIPNSLYFLGSQTSLAWTQPFRNPAGLLFLSINLLATPLYFTILEGLWSASLGKMICRLRVVDLERNPPGILRAFLRTLVIELLPALPTMLLTGLWISAGSLERASWWTMLIGNSSYLIIALIFSTARRRNGFAAVHDLLTRTRVVLNSSLAARPGIETPEETAVQAEDGPKLGPYRVLGPLSPDPTDNLLSGYDERLLRKVWIRKVTPATPPVPDAIRNLTRPGRIRWLNGKRSPEESWDAYESLAGQSLLKLIGKPQPWEIVRFWLFDLAEELKADSKDGILLPFLKLDRIWITTDGRARLLDFPAPGAHAPSNPIEVDEAPGGPSLIEPRTGETLQFLKQIAASSLEGRIVSREQAQPDAVLRPLPLHARTFLTALQNGPAPADIVDHLEPLLKKTARISRGRRLALMGLCAAFPMLVIVFILIVPFTVKRSLANNPELGKLRESLAQLISLRSGRDSNSGLDSLGAAYSGNLLGTSVLWNHAPFSLGPTNAANFISSTGQVIALPPGNFTNLLMLATAVKGNQTSQLFAVTYLNGSRSNVFQSFSDWLTPQNYPAESIVMRFPYRNLSLGQKDNHPFHLFGYSFSLDPEKAARFFTLPNNTNIEILALTLASPLSPVDLSALFNGMNGIVADGSVFSDRQRLCKAFETYIPGHFRQSITNSASWGLAGAILISGDQRELAQQLVASNAAPSEEEIAQATLEVQAFLAAQKLAVASGGSGQKSVPKSYSFPIMGSATVAPGILALICLCAFAIYVGIPALVAALLFRGGLLFRLLGIIVVLNDGRRASRIRVFLRSLIAWFPFFVLTCLTALPLSESSPVLRQSQVAVALVIGILGLYSAFLPDRGIQDRLAGTWLVPR